ncbi:MAG: 16S rRNA (cytosine(967)-C(5))-methyltransferase RsmB [Terriglobales bacterium]
MSISPARAAAFDILLRVEKHSAYATELLHSTNTDHLSPADRGLCMEIVMGVLRWRSRLDEHIVRFSFTPFRKLDIEVLTALRMGAYQLEFLDRVPARAAVNESVELVKRGRKASAAALANVVLRKISQNISTAEDTEGAEEPRFITADLLAKKYAHPEWLVGRWVAQYGAETTTKICHFNQAAPTTALRLRDAAAEEELRAENIELAPGVLLTSARRVVSGDPTRTRACAAGAAYVQDEGSQLIAALVGRGQRILDCCAAPGGKTAALADRNPQAQIIAVELHEHRARLMRRLVPAANVRIIAADATMLPVSGGFDRVLVDVPCSGTGTLARNPEIKWRLQPKDLSELHARQVAILSAALEHVAPGGRLLYSTCSLEEEENQAVVEEALHKKKSDFRLLDCREELQQLKQNGEMVWDDIGSLMQALFLRTIPGVHPCDGFFAAVLEKP